MAEPPTLIIEQITALCQLLEGKGLRRPGMIEQFVLSALAIGLLMQAVPGISKRLAVLRDPMLADRFPLLWSVFLVTLHVSQASFFPQDEFLMPETALSGVQDFVEPIRADARQTSVDLLMGQLQRIVV